jgi:hypothetical protein
MKICILITTYNRNNYLINLIEKINYFFSQYNGTNNYFLCITDSNTNNEISELIASKCNHYLINQGSGFDDNLYYFYKNHAHNYDYILSISDDDMFAIHTINPLEIIDLTIKTNSNVILFNHFNFFYEDEQRIKVLEREYNSAAFSFNKNFLFNHSISLLPKHIGIIYSSEVILKNIEKIELFRNTLHLYAVAFVIEAQKGEVMFIDYPLFYFSNKPKNEGAWENKELVFTGLMKFLKMLKLIINADAYEIAKQGFFKNYFGSNAWLRKTIFMGGGIIPSEDNVYSYLENE